MVKQVQHNRLNFSATSQPSTNHTVQPRLVVRVEGQIGVQGCFVKHITVCDSGYPQMNESCQTLFFVWLSVPSWSLNINLFWGLFLAARLLSIAVFVPRNFSGFHKLIIWVFACCDSWPFVGNFVIILKTLWVCFPRWN